METDTPVGIESRRVRVASEARLTTCGGNLGGYMNPALWSALPKELLQMVFVRMPFPQISQILRLLSKEWKQDLITGGSELNRGCAEANPKMVGMIKELKSGDTDSEYDELGFPRIRLYDVKGSVWHSYFIRMENAPLDAPFLMSASAGLVCYVSNHQVTEKKPLCIIVCNPLTGQCKALPPQSLSHLQPTMVQLVTNPDKSYQVIVVADKTGHQCCKAIYSAMIYSSVLGAWNCSETMSSCIFGHECFWSAADEVDGGGERLFIGDPCVFDCARGDFLMLNSLSAPYTTVPYAQWDLVDDHLFVLDKEGDTEGPPCYCISEYQAQMCEPYWVKLRVYKCPEFNGVLEPSYDIGLDVCKGFMMVIASNDNSDSYKHKLAWFYDFSTNKWKAIAANFENVLNGAVMCDLLWDALP